jgi:hypothetical protein
MTAGARKPEAQVEREVLRAVGATRDVLLLRNEVGQGHPAAVRFALQEALAPFGPAVVATALSVLKRHTIRWGLGVGSPDLVGSVAGRAGGLELKAPDGVVSEEQRRWHTAARRRGTFVAVVRSAEEAQEAVERWRKGERE